jgi:DALR anticodon binding domain
VSGSSTARERYWATVDYRSPTQWLTDRLAAVCTLEGMTQSLDRLPTPMLDRQSLGTISTPLPLKLAHLKSTGTRSSTSTIAAAAEIGKRSIEQLSRLPQHSWIEPCYWMHPNGWLYAQFSPDSLAQWLQSLLTLKPQLELQSSLQHEPAIAAGISNDPVQFEMQVAHARCCSLLRLAQQSALVQMTASHSGFLQPDPTSWQTPQGDLRFQTRSEHEVLLALMEFPQSLCPSKTVPNSQPMSEAGTRTLMPWPLSDRAIYNQLQVWNQIFDRFYRESRIFGLRAESLQLAQSRLALVMLLRNILEFWLLKILQIEAPMEL